MQKVGRKINSFYFLLKFLSITILLSIVVCIYYYYCHTKHQSKQNHVLPYYFSNNRLKENDIKNRFYDIKNDIKNRLMLLL